MATLITVMVMFFAIKYLNPMIRPHLNRLPLGEGIATVLASFALYKSLAKLSYIILRSQRWLRRLLLGPESLEGTWVGMIRRRPLEYTVEVFTQEDGLLKVEGDSYLEDGTPRAHWESIAARIDTSNQRLVYAYTCHIEGVQHDHEGVASFRLEWDGIPHRKPPNRLEGYAADLTDGKRDANTEFKVSNRPLSKGAALDKAREKTKQVPNPAAEPGGFAAG